MDVRREDYDHLVELIYEMRQGDVHELVFQAHRDSPKIPLTLRAPEPYEREIWVGSGLEDPEGTPLWHWEIRPGGRAWYRIRQVFRDGVIVRHSEHRHPMEAASVALGLAFKAL